MSLRKSITVALLLVTFARTVDASESFKVMSYNILADWLEHVYDQSVNMEWDDLDFPRRDRIAAILSQEDADVIGFQEMTDTQLPDFISSLPEHDYVLGDQGRSFFNAIFYKRDRFQLQNQGWIDYGSHKFRHLQWSHLLDTTSNQNFAIFNTHLDEDDQAIEIQELMPTVALGLPVILTGDMNSGPYDYRTRTIMGLGDPRYIQMSDACVPGCGSQNTSPLHPHIDRIDYVFHSPDLQQLGGGQVVTTTVDGFWPSDHLPVTAEFSLPQIENRQVISRATSYYNVIDFEPLNGMGNVATQNFTINYIGMRRDIYSYALGSYRQINKFQLPDPEEIGGVLEQAKLFVFVQDVSDTPLPGISLLHSADDNNLDQEASDYEAPYVDTGLILSVTSDGTGQYYELDVTDLIRADYESDGADPIAAFRLQSLGGEPTEEPFPWYRIGDGSHVPYLKLNFTPVPEPTTCTLALTALCLAMSRRRIAAR